jgi:hypothetical protein
VIEITEHEMVADSTSSARRSTIFAPAARASPSTTPERDTPG